MKRIHYALMGGLLALLPLSAAAQTEDDIVLYSQENPAITARGLAMGNAAGTLGADYTGLSCNPATLGMYRQSDIGFSFGLGLDHRATSYLNETHRTNSFFGSFNNFGLVLSLRLLAGEGYTPGWQGINLGVSYSRLNDYTYSSVARAHNAHDSYADMLASVANRLGLTSDHLNPGTAYNNYNPHVVVAWGAHILDEIVTDPANKLVRIVSPLGQTETVYQTFGVKQRGDMSEWAFSVGSNYSHTLYLGATIGVPVLSRALERTYEEVNDTPVRTTNFRDYRIRHQLKEKGAGVNAKLGAIFSPISFLRIGLALHTPSLLVINYTEDLESRASFLGQSDKTAESPKYTGRYTVLTPLRGKGSLGIMMGRYGMLTADYSLDLYPFTRIVYGGGADGFSDELVPDLRAAHSAQVGLELLAGAFAFRGGVGGSTSPYKERGQEPFSLPRQFVTGGVGFASSLLYLDVAYRYLTDHSSRYIYDFTNDAGINTRYEASMKGWNHQLLFTLGVRL